MKNKIHKRNHPLLLVVLSFGFIMAVLDATGVILAMPEISKNLNIPLKDTIWIANAYTLALGTFLLFAGSLSNKYGAKKILIIGMILFVLSSFTCSVSGNIIIVICFRFIQGLGAALFMPSSMALLFTAYPNEEKRSKMLGIWSSIISVATGTGSFIGGAMIQYLGWRGVFLINIPIGITTILYIVTVIREDNKNQDTKIGFWGHFLFVICISSIIIFLVEGKQYGYTNRNIILFLINAICVGIIFILRERKTAYPIIPKILLKKPKFIIANLLGLILNMSLYGIILILGMYFQIFLGLSPMVSGLLIFPGMAALIIGNLLYARIVTKISACRLMTGSVGMAAFVTSVMYLLSLTVTILPVFVIVLSILIMNVGIGVLIPAATTILMESSGKEYASIAGAVLNANKQIGGLFGTAIAGMIVTSYGNAWHEIIQITFLANIIFYLIGFISAKRFVSD